jgi:hypothetical protein
MLTADKDVLDFFQVMFYDTLEQVFRIICRIEEITPDQEEELRRLLLRPSDISVMIKQ